MMKNAKKNLMRMLMMASKTKLTPPLELLNTKRLKKYKIKQWVATRVSIFNQLSIQISDLSPTLDKNTVPYIN